MNGSIIASNFIAATAGASIKVPVVVRDSCNIPTDVLRGHVLRACMHQETSEQLHSWSKLQDNA
jgi:hypothetical protein